MITARILIVEDESILALDIEDILENLGYTVVGNAIDAVEALSLAEQFRPDLVLMDVRIQGEKDGIETTAEVWERFKIPVVFLTASVDDSTLKRIHASPSYGYVPKPFTLEDLSEAIQTTLQKHNAATPIDQNQF